MVIIALCGESGAGKSTTADILRRHGFAAFSISGFLREEAIEHRAAATRSEIQNHARSAQQQHGNDYYARLLLTRTNILNEPRAVIDGLRNTDELATLRNGAAEHGATFKVLAVVLDPTERFRRVNDRGRGGDPTALDVFLANDARANGADGAFQNNRALIDDADWRVENTGDLQTLETRVLELISTVTRPTL